jgi:hypothetical protein
MDRLLSVSRDPGHSELILILQLDMVLNHRGVGILASGVFLWSGLVGIMPVPGRYQKLILLLGRSV